ncbi:MAG: nitrilase-related carbon-nitrogen hydrolase [Rhodospirillaceae bacterium]|nr:nitrilase-related carbon-nitrogen hydrolase [Rhodospirillaceae bacterium]
MILLQTPWSPTDLTQARAALSHARRAMTDGGPVLALLPHADDDGAVVLEESAVTAALAALATAHDLYLGGSTLVTCDDGLTRTVGYLVAPDGRVLLRTRKILPDVVAGFSDTTAETFAPARVAVVKTPLGQVGLLCGEDVLAPHLVRTLMVRGAEIILNPSRELGDHLLGIRNLARVARAYENLCYVAAASPRSTTVNGGAVTLPAATGLYPWQGPPQMAGAGDSYVRAPVDLETLRQRRLGPALNFPAIVRMNLYAAGYANDAGPDRIAPRTRAGWIAEAKARVAAQARPPRKDAIDLYGVMVCQHVVHQSNTVEELNPKHHKNLDDAFALIRQYMGRATNMKLAVFPEFFTTGPVSPLGNKLGHIADKIGVTFPGPVMDRVAKFAQDTRCYIAGGVFEYDPDWPQRFFNTAFIYDDQGNLIHRYRKIHCGDAMGFLPDTTPGSVYDQYVQKYGYEHLFPVADTPIGRLATVICFDNNFPETHRAMARRGAEVIIHPTSEPHGAHRQGWDAARRLRAFENTAYVVTAGHGGEYFLPGAVVPSARARGYSKIVNFDGSIQAEADTDGQVPLAGVIDLRALRRARADVQANLMIWDEPAVYAAEYAASTRGLPNNLWPDDPLGNPYAGSAQIKKVIAAYLKEGIFASPDSADAAYPAKAAE